MGKPYPKHILTQELAESLSGIVRTGAANPDHPETVKLAEMGLVAVDGGDWHATALGLERLNKYQKRSKKKPVKTTSVGIEAEGSQVASCHIKFEFEITDEARVADLSRMGAALRKALEDFADGGVSIHVLAGGATLWV